MSDNDIRTPNGLWVLPDGTYLNHEPSFEEYNAALALVVDPGSEDPRAPRDPETGAPPAERPAGEPTTDPLPNVSPWGPDDPGEGPDGDPAYGKTKAVQKWADIAMWSAPKHDDPQRVKVTITMMIDDPLGTMAMINGMYTGKIYRSPAEVSDDERRQAWEDFAASRLSEAPAEWFQLSVLYENVTRAFTHQLVRTRLSTFAQESMRFAVKEDAHDSVKLPPSIAGTTPANEHARGLIGEGLDYDANTSREQRWRRIWDSTVEIIASNYQELIDDGMPAEDARGLLPTNILTRIHDRYDIKTLRNQAGMRLCTQAQFEWREAFSRVVEALREYVPVGHPQRWQFELIAGSFRPVCYAAGRCVMKAKADRYCSIRDQVDDFESAGVPSADWEGESRSGLHPQHGIPFIRPAQWLADPTAARVAP